MTQESMAKWCTDLKFYCSQHTHTHKQTQQILWGYSGLVGYGSTEFGK